MKVIRGNLLALAQAGRFDVIVHGCNCRHAMGAGIAERIKNTFPAAFAADLSTPYGAQKLGQISTAETDCNGHRLTVVNAYTQDDWQGDGVLLDYGALRRAMREVKRRFGGKRIAYPKIGAGLARGDWAKIAAVIDEELAGETHTLVEYGGTDTEAV